MVCVLADGGWKYLSAGFWEGEEIDEEETVVVVPPPVREALAEHARRELPNESCGLLVLRDRVADRYEPGRNAAESPYRFELEVDPDLWFLEDRATSSRSSTRTSRHRRDPHAPTSRTSASGKDARTSSTRLPATSWPRGRSPTARSSPSPSAETGGTTTGRYSTSSSSTYSVTESRGWGRSRKVTAIRSIRLPSTSSTSKRIPSCSTSSPGSGARPS